MKRHTYEWVLRDERAATEERYCAHCGRKTVFRDSMKRRVNANGKDLYEFAIFKCERDHTWNKILSRTKAKTGEERNFKNSSVPGPEMSPIDLELCQKENVCEIEIVLTDVAGKWRLDKLLAQQIPGWSRSRIERLIADESIRIEGRTTDAGTFLRTGDVIKIKL